jgi:CubicO group peptidase (beta-lactamase class C family)
MTNPMTARTRQGFSVQRLAALRAPLARAVEAGEMPGAVGLVLRHGEPVHEDVVGWQDVGQRLPMRADTVFCIASLSKPITSVAALMLVERGVLRLDDPVARWLPELAAPKVLPRPDAPLAEARPARGFITLRHLLSHRSGLVYPVDAEMLKVLPVDPRTPLEHAVAEAGLSGRPHQAPDAFMARLATLPLRCEPGEGFAYGFSTDVLGVLIARASGRPFGRFLAEEVFGPLGMVDSGFEVDARRAERLAPIYVRGADGRLVDSDTLDPPPWGYHPRASLLAPPAFESGGAGLLSTAPDLLRFQQMLLQGGRLGDVRLLSRNTVNLMCTDQMTEAQRSESIFGFAGIWRGMGFGLGVSIVDRPQWHHSMEPRGSFGWGGLYGGSATAVPSEGLAYVYLTSLHQGDLHCRARVDWVTLLLAALDD